MTDELYVNVDGYVRKIPKEARFIEFSSREEAQNTGAVRAYDAEAKELELETIHLEQPQHWSKLIPPNKPSKP